MKKIVGLSLALMMVVGMTCVATVARFTDNETSSGNKLAAGTLDLKTNNANGVSQTLYATSMSPGATVVSPTITLRNAGTTNGSTLDIAFSYVENDTSPNSVDKTADEVAAVIEVKTLEYDTHSLLDPLFTPHVTDINGNGYLDIQDLKNSSLTGLGGINAGDPKSFNISIQLKTGTGSDFRADGITITMTFTLKQ